MAHRLLQEPEQEGWERSDFPIVCETCLGPNPYVRMQRMEYGAECHISGRPYTKFRWRPGNDARYKATIICQEVAKAKNVCQVCLLDLDYNLPVQARDAALNAVVEEIPESDVGKEYALALKESQGTTESSFSKERPNDTIRLLQRTQPYYQRNRAQICSFFVRGECKRGAECPYRHEMPTTGELAEQNIRDRYYGVNDPVAKKMLNRLGEQAPKMEPPADTSITTLYIGGIQPDFTQEDVREPFFKFGEISTLKLVPHRNCAFITFATREEAEKAAESLNGRLVIRGSRCKLLWGKPQQVRVPGGEVGSSGAPSPAPLQPAAQQSGGMPDFFGVPAPYSNTLYPSMDPSLMGTSLAEARVPSASEPSDPKRRRVEPPGAPGGPHMGPPRPEFMPPPAGMYGPPPPGWRPQSMPPHGFPVAAPPLMMMPGRPPMLMSAPPPGMVLMPPPFGQQVPPGPNMGPPPVRPPMGQPAL